MVEVRELLHLAAAVWNESRSHREDRMKVQAEQLGVVVEQDQGDLAEMNTASQKVGEVVGAGMEDIKLLSIKTQENNEASRQIAEVIMKTDEKDVLIRE